MFAVDTAAQDEPTPADLPDATAGSTADAVGEAPTPAEEPAADKAPADLPPPEDDPTKAPLMAGSATTGTSTSSCSIYRIMHLGSTCYWCFQSCGTNNTTQGYASCSLPLCTCNGNDCNGPTSATAVSFQNLKPVNWLKNPTTSSVRNRFEPSVPAAHKAKRNYSLVDGRLYRVNWTDEMGAAQTARVQTFELNVNDTAGNNYRCWVAFAVAFPSPQQQAEFDGMATVVDGTPETVDDVDFVKFEDDFTPDGMDNPVEFTALLNPML